MTSWSEKRLIRKVRRGDERAFRALVERYQDGVYNLVYRMLGDAAEAEELTQDVFIAVFRHIDSFRGDAKLSTWLHRIATNQARNRIKYLARRRTKQRADLEALEQGEAALSHPLGEVLPRPDGACMGRELEALLQRAIAELCDEQRVLVILREIEGRSYAEIEAITGLATGTVKSRLHRARLRLKGVIDAYLAGAPDPTRGETARALPTIAPTQMASPNSESTRSRERERA